MRRWPSVSLVLACAVAAGGAAPDDVTASGDFDQGLQDRLTSSGGQAYYRSAVEVLPNTVYSIDGEPAESIADLVVVGDITDVEPGVGFTVEGDDAPDGTAVPFDDDKALWRTLHVSIDVAEVIGPGAAPPTVTLGLAIDAATSFESAAASLQPMDPVVAFLYKGSAVLAYDPSLLAVVDDGRWIVRVSDSGRLQLPYIPAGASAKLLADATTLDELREAGTKPRQTIQLERQEGVLVRTP